MFVKNISMRRLKEWFDGLTQNQQITVSILIPIVLFLIIYPIAYEASGYDVRVFYRDPFERDVDERHYGGAFDWVETWYIWFTYVIIVGIFEFIIWGKKSK